MVVPARKRRGLGNKVVLEEAVARELELLRRKPEAVTSVPYASRLSRMSTRAIRYGIGFNNYREHTQKGTQELADSIEEVGLIEPITLHYDTSMNEWDFIDGEGRFWGSVLAEASSVPVEVYYDIPADVRQEMKLKLNSTKTRIPPEDIARFAETLYSAMKEERRQRGVTKDPSIREVADLLGRNEQTVGEYFSYNELHHLVRQYVNDHPEQQLFGRGVKIAKTLRDHEEQLAFFRMTVEEYARKKARASNTQFNRMLHEASMGVYVDDLQAYATKKQRQAIMKNGRHAKAKEMTCCLENVVNFSTAFLHLLDVSPEMRREAKAYSFNHTGKTLGGLLEEALHVQGLVMESLQALPKDSHESMMVENGLRLYDNELAQKRRTSFRERIAALTKQQRGDKDIRTMGDELVYVSTDQVTPDEDQLRQKCDEDKIKEMAVDFRKFGQVKAGTIKPDGMLPDGRAAYKIVVGETRYWAAVEAGTPYKAFIKHDLDDLHSKVLQAMEDLSEQDKPTERARGINEHYRLSLERKRNEWLLEHDGPPPADEELYSKARFAAEHPKLGDRKTIKKALAFMELPKSIRLMVPSGVLSYDNAVLIGALPEKEQFAFLYKAVVGVVNARQLKERIKTTAFERAYRVEQHALFNQEEGKNYSLVFNEFETRLSRGMQYVLSRTRAAEKEDKLRADVLAHTKNYQRLAVLKRSIESLQKYA